MELLLKGGFKEYRTSANLLGINIVPAATKRKRFESFDEEETAVEVFEKIKKACLNKDPLPQMVTKPQFSIHLLN